MPSSADHHLATGPATLLRMAAQTAPVLKKFGAVIGESVARGVMAGGHPLPILRSQNLPGAVDDNRGPGARYKDRLGRPLA